MHTDPFLAASKQALGVALPAEDQDATLEGDWTEARARLDSLLDAIGARSKP